MEREKLARAGSKSRARGAATAATESTVSDALGGEKAISLGGREFRLRGLDLNDLCEVEEAYGTFEQFLADVSKQRMTAVRFLFWLSLRKSDPSLSEDDRKAGTYPMTPEEAGSLIPLQGDRISKILGHIMTASGLEMKGADEGNAETPAAPSIGG